jgi:hypothetical protein
MTAAQRPRVEYVGMTPIRNVARPMKRSVAIKVALRPMRSPYVPKSQAPIGLARKPTKKMT